MKIKDLLLLFISSSFLVLDTNGANELPYHDKQRVIRVKVLGLDGIPATGRTVVLHGISRDAVGFSVDSENIKYFRFQTDKNGTCQITLWHDLDENDTNTWRLPDGKVYTVLVEPSRNDAGAVSERIENPSEIPASGLNLTLKVQQGFTLKGRVFDYEHPKKPLRGISVRVGNNLHVDTHTGEGGDIFESTIPTDANGAFQIRHIYPAEDPTLRIYANWLRTKVNGSWVDQPSSALCAPDGTNVVSIEAQATRENLFCYFGRITTEDGKVAAGAQFVAAPSSSPDSESWGDNHCFEETKVDQYGNYKYFAPTPWVRFIRAQAEGYATQDIESPEAGKYNFVLLPEPKESPTPDKVR